MLMSAAGDVVANVRTLTGGANGLPELYVYRRTGSVWALEAAIDPPSPVTNDGQGTLMSADGNVVIIGGTARATTYRRINAAWTIPQQTGGTYPRVGVLGPTGAWALWRTGDTAVFLVPDSSGRWTTPPTRRRWRVTTPRRVGARRSMSATSAARC
ncbi:MAG: hypothetical protein HYX52_10035 [Chloroflexi bacterium]|nr:hypothetical protein [Chloroflexota bacterium]